MRTEVQRLTVPCPVDNRLAKVEVRCQVQECPGRQSQEQRVLTKIVGCTFGRPGIACYPACEEEIRRLVEC